MFMYGWWTFAFEFVALHGPMAEVFSPRFKLGSIGLLAVGAVLLMDRADSFLRLAQGADDAAVDLGATASRAHLAFAGCIICCLANFYLICLLGE